jgi:anti-sigma regulatory factor (Ser/Thr protein kinase)
VVLQFDWCHETSLSAEPRSAGRARAFVVHHLSEHRLDHLVEPVRLIASELATNAVVHARTAFTVTLSQWDNVVTLSVEDAQPTQVLTVPAWPDPLADHGRGLTIVDQMSDKWGFSTDPRGGKSVWASFAR